MKKDAVIEPMEFRFTEPSDVEKYGDEWYVYSELDIISTPAAVLIELERELDISITTIMDGFRQSSVLGDTGAAWLAMRLAGRRVPWGTFTPCSMLLEWREAGPGKEPAEDSAPTSIDTVPPPTVTLPTLPASE